MPTLPEVAARGHEVEFQWNLTDPSEMQAYCRRCQSWFGASCDDPTEYIEIRRSQQRAAKPFADFDCFTAQELQRVRAERQALEQQLAEVQSEIDKAAFAVLNQGDD
jgi:hypothetical protein